MPTLGNEIQYSDFSALETLANAKLIPITPFSFPPFAGKEKVALPADITPVATYGTGSWPDGQKVTLWLYAYKIIAGVKTYTWNPLVKAFIPVASSGTFSMTWTWVAPTGATAPDGYVAVIPFQNLGFNYAWQDLGNVTTLTEEGSLLDPAWKFDTTLDQRNGGHPDQNLPCGHGAWIKPWNLIHQQSCWKTDINCLNSGDVTGLESVGGDGQVGSGSITPLGIISLVSGPWCVAVCGGAGANTLTAWISRFLMYVQYATHGFSPGYTQVYRNIKFYFRAADGPTVNITASNTLANFTVGSDLLTDTTAHYHLRVVSCSNGHLLVKDSLGGTIRADLDVTAGNTYDLSFDATVFGSLGLSWPLLLDFTFTTAAATGTGSTAAGIELNNDVRSIGVPDSYCEIEFNNPVLNTVDAYASVQLCTTCLQLTLTENNNVPGVWVANTIPTLGIMPYLDQDLPQYSPNPVPSNASSRRIALDLSLPYEPYVDNRGALWPVFRDTDFVPDSVAGQPVNGSTAWQVLGTKLVGVADAADFVPPYEPGEVLQNYVITVPFNAAQLRFYTSNPDFTLYAKAGGFPTVADHDFSVAGGTWFSAPAGFATNAAWFFAVQNNGASSAQSRTIGLWVNASLPNGTFFPTITDDFGNQVPQTEGYSYNWTDPPSTTLRPIPQYGYCVYSLTVRRLPVDNGFGVLLAPSTGTSALNVDVGIMAGFGWGAQGTFTKIQTVTIPAGQASITVPVFLPVLSGTPLAYQCSQQVMIRAAVNFQPLIHSLFSSKTTKVSGNDYSVGYYSGAPFYDTNNAMLSFVGGFIDAPIVLPISATVFNDLEAVLNLLP